jgi:glutaredoxin
VREFLSQNSIEYEDRNIAFQPHWRRELKELTGEIVVPVLFVGGKRVIGLDESGIAEALGLQSPIKLSNRDGLASPPELAELSDSRTGELETDLTHLARRLQQEMEFNAEKDEAAYRDGVHDGLRFARDAVLRILTGKYEPEKIAAERESEGT